MIGESGSGKTTLAYSLFGILPEGWKCSYEEWSVLGNSLPAMADKIKKQGNARSLFLVPQNPNLAFHPYRQLGDQLQDFFRYTLGETFDKKKVFVLWEEMGIKMDKNVLDRLPESFSGGEKQRICVSLAILAKPRILVLDEPTTGLDASTEKWVLQQIKRMAAASGCAVFFITHDLRIVESLASEITIMKEGSIVETISVKERKFEPRSEYGKALEKACRLFV